jgi:hypothetical protein
MNMIDIGSLRENNYLKMTKTKSHDEPIFHIDIYLPWPLFNHGQLYVQIHHTIVFHLTSTHENSFYTTQL